MSRPCSSVSHSSVRLAQKNEQNSFLTARLTSSPYHGNTGDLLIKRDRCSSEVVLDRCCSPVMLLLYCMILYQFFIRVLPWGEQVRNFNSLVWIRFRSAKTFSDLTQSWTRDSHRSFPWDGNWTPDDVYQLVTQYGFLDNIWHCGVLVIAEPCLDKERNGLSTEFDNFASQSHCHLLLVHFNGSGDL